MRFKNAKPSRIAILVRILGNNYLEEIFVSQVTIYMLRPLSCHRLFLARLKKPGVKDWRAPNNSGLEYSIRVPSNVKEAAQFDQDSGNKIWSNAILK